MVNRYSNFSDLFDHLINKKVEIALQSCIETNPSDTTITINLFCIFYFYNLIPTGLILKLRYLKLKTYLIQYKKYEFE